MALERIRDRRILWLMTAQPGFSGGFDRHPNVSHLSLSRLDRESIVEFVGYLAHGKALPVKLVHDIAAKTDGVPLFVEELTKSMLESGKHTPSQAQPLIVGAMLAGLSRLQRDFAQRVDDAEAFTLEHKFQMWHGFATCLRAWVDLERGDEVKALHGVTGGRAMLSATGTRFLYPLVAVIESRALAAGGGWDRALGVLRDAQQHQDATAEHWLACEVWRTMGDIQRMAPGGDPGVAEASYQHALELSRTQGARSWELRAASSLADLACLRNP